MMATNDDLANLRKIAADSKEATDAELQQELAALSRITRAQPDAPKPRPACGAATFNSLVQACEQATAANTSIAEFTTRLKTLGQGVLSVARRASTLLPI